MIVLLIFGWHKNSEPFFYFIFIFGLQALDLSAFLNNNKKANHFLLVSLIIVEWIWCEVGHLLFQLVIVKI